MAVLLGLAAALGFGSGDFLGGLASKRSPTLSVLLVLQTVGLAIAVAWVAIDGFPSVPGENLVQGALAGVSGVTGLGLLFRGLATGRMGVVAPVSAVVTSLTPVLWGILQDERPSEVAWAGVGVAMVAMILIARTPDHAAPSGSGDDAAAAHPLLLGFLSGFAFGATVTLFAEAADGGAFWPLVASRGAALPVLVAVALAVGRMRLPHRGDRRAVLGAAVLDVMANGVLLLAFRRGLTSLVGPISGLYPASTVILARIVLGETLTRLQIAGLLAALTGVVLVGTG